MSNKEILIETTSKLVADEVVDGKRKRKYKTEHSIFLRLTKGVYDALQAKKEETELSVNSLASLCIINQLGNLPNFKVDGIDVFYTDEEGKKKLSFKGNTLNKVSNFKKGEQDEWWNL